MVKARFPGAAGILAIVGGIAAGPTWIRTDRFDIIATTGGNISRNQTMLMLQTLLADRFQLKIARETQTGTVYTLTAPNAHDLRPPAKPDDPSRIQPFFERNPPTISYHLDGSNATIGELAMKLSGLGEVHAPVIDQTHLDGHYDFRINYSCFSTCQGLDPDPDIPTILTAIQKEVGLKLTAGQGPVEVYAVHGAAKPASD